MPPPLPLPPTPPTRSGIPKTDLRPYGYSHSEPVDRKHVTL